MPGVIQWRHLATVEHTSFSSGERSGLEHEIRELLAYGRPTPHGVANITSWRTEDW